MIQDQGPHRNIQQTESYDDQSHHGSAAESDFQPLIQRLAGGMGRTRRSERRRTHPDKTRQPGKQAAGQERERHPRILHTEAIGKKRKEQHEDQKYDRNHPVLLPEVGHRPFTDVRGDLFHTGSAFALFHHRAEKVPCEAQRYQRGDRHEPENKWCVTHNG